MWNRRKREKEEGDERHRERIEKEDRRERKGGVENSKGRNVRRRGGRRRQRQGHSLHCHHTPESGTRGQAASHYISELLSSDNQCQVSTQTR